MVSWSPSKLKALSGHNTTNEMRHEKTDLKVFVVVIPNEGWARMAAPILLLVWHRLFRIWVFWLHRSYSLIVGVIAKEGWARPRTPILLLLWQRQRHYKVCFPVTHVKKSGIHDDTSFCSQKVDTLYKQNCKYTAHAVIINNVCATLKAGNQPGLCLITMDLGHLWLCYTRVTYEMFACMKFSRISRGGYLRGIGSDIVSFKWP